MVNAWDFTKYKLCHRYFDKNLQKIFRRNILENGSGQILLIVVLMVVVLIVVLVDLNDSIFTCLPSLHIFVWILRAVMYQSAEAYPRPSKIYKINLFARIVNLFKLTLLTIFAKSNTMYVWRALITPLICSNACN